MNCSHYFKAPAAGLSTGRRRRATPLTRFSLPVTRFLLSLILLSLPRVALLAKEVLSPDASNGPLIDVQIAGNNLKIPRYYFLSFDVPLSPKRNDIWIHALWPDMAPMREDNKERWIHIRGFGPLLDILVLDQNKTTSLDFRLATAEKLGKPYSRQPDKFELQVYVPNGSVTPNDAELRQELYVDKSPSGLTGFISCNVDGTVPEPGCEADFDCKEMLLQVTYGKYFLPQWSAIEQATRELFDGFAAHAELPYSSLGHSL
jgi:hypothetical protein